MAIYTKIADDGGKWVEIGTSSGGLPGLGGWATITAVSGVYTPHRYNDGPGGVGGTDWVAYEFTDDGTITTSDGLVDLLLVGAGGERNAVTTASLGPGGRSGAGNGGGLVTGLWEVTAAPHDITVGTTAANNSAQSGSPTTFDAITIPAPGGGYAGSNRRGSSALATFVGMGNGAPGFKSSITGTETEYGRGGYLGSSGTDGWTHDNITPSEMPSTAGTFGWGGSVYPYDTAGGGHGHPATPGVVIIRVPAANATVTRENPHGWLNFATVENGVVTSVNKTPDNVPYTTAVDEIPCGPEVAEGWNYDGSEFVAPEPDYSEQIKELEEMLKNLRGDL